MYGAADITDEVVRLAAEGSRPELGQIVETVQPQLQLMVAARLSPSPAQYHAAEDLAQQVLLALTRGIGNLQHQTVGGLKAYLSGIVMRTVADFIRRRGRGGDVAREAGSLDSVIVGVSNAGPLWQFLSGSIASPRSEIDRAEQVTRLMSELGRLKPEYHKVITLAFCDQLPTGEIASQMNLSQRAASMLLLRAVRALRRNMEALSRIGKVDSHASRI